MKKITLLLMGIGVAFTGFSQVPIYEEDFEAGIGSWVIDNAINGSWAHGIPSGPMINSAASGTFSVVTNPMGGYNGLEDGTVTSPLISTVGATGKEEINMSVWWESQTDWDGANISASYDGGSTWDDVIGAGVNWYTGTSWNPTANGTDDVWEGSSGGWVTASHPLDSAKMVDSTSVMLRVAFGSDAGAFNDDGFAFDDVIIRAPIRVDLSAAAVEIPRQCDYGTSEPVTITVCNIGDTTYMAGAVIPVSYSLNGGTIVGENIILVADLATDSCIDYTFTVLGDFSTIGTNNIVSWVSYGGDLQNDNDTATASIFHSAATLPYFENFEVDQAGWVVNTVGTGSFEHGVPSTPDIDTAASGMNAFVTNLTGNYFPDETGEVTSPCIDISGATGDEVVTMKVRWQSESSWDGANLFSSYDNGATWNIVGAANDPNNWYNDNSINGTPNNSQEGWTGRDVNGSAGWVVAQHELDSAMLVDSASLMLRVGFGSDGSVFDEGFAFDDVSVGLPTHTYEYGVAGIDTVEVCEITTTSFTLDAGAGHSFYNWVDANDNVFNGNWSNGQTFTVTSSGTYVITVTNAMGMMATDTVQVNFLNFVPPTLIDVVDCAPGAIATFDAGLGSGDLVYSWSTGDISQTSTLSAEGTIFVTKTDTLLGCSASDTAIFTSMPIFTLGSDLEICEGDSVVLDADPNTIATYAWSDGTMNQTLAVSVAGDYFVTVTDGNGCEGSDSLTLLVNANPIVDLGEDRVFCTTGNTSLPLDAGTAVSYLWNDGSTSQTLIPTLSGLYDVTITDGNGCMGSDTVIIIIQTCVGINEVSNDTEVKMYPNPTQGGLTIELASFNKDVDMKILTVYGQIVRSERITSTNTILDLNDLSEGTYILQLKSENSTSVNKFVINR